MAIKCNKCGSEARKIYENDSKSISKYKCNKCGSVSGILTGKPAITGGAISHNCDVAPDDSWPYTE